MCSARIRPLRTPDPSPRGRLAAAGLLLVAARFTDRPGDFAPPWYSAWALLPGAFLLAGAAAMSIFAAFIELAPILPTSWVLLASGAVAWAAALAWVRRAPG